MAITSATVLHDGAKLQIGAQTLRVERRRDAAEAGRTIVVRPGASLVVPALGPAGRGGQATQFGMKPRVRSGYALKRLDASEGSKRWVLKDLNRNTFLRLSDNDAQLFELLDGTHSLSDLIGIAEQRHGAAGAPRLARLLADLGERGYLAGVAGTDAMADEPSGFFRKLVKPREKTVGGSGPGSTALYRARRLDPVHEARAVRDRRADRRGARRVHLPDHRALRDAVRRLAADRARRARLPARALRWWSPCTRPRTG